MEGAVVGATLRARKDSKAITADDGLGERNHAAYEAFDPERHRLLHQETLQRSKKRRSLLPEEKLNEWLFAHDDGGISKRKWVLKELMERCVVVARRNVNYRNLAAFVCFTLLFACVLNAQRRPQENFQMADVMLKILPTQPNGKLSQPMGSWEEVHQAIETQILNIYVDPQCGDGICDMPHEFPAWGNPDHRYGCEADCGKDGNVTSLVLHLDYTQPVQGLLSEKLAQEAAGFDVAAEPLRWNLCNQEFEDMCWYKEYQTINPGEVLSLRVQLPDDDWRVSLEGDSRYLRGYMTTESDPEEACKTDCTTSDNCVFTCERPQGADLSFLDQLSEVTASSYNDSSTTTPAQATTRTHHVVAFEMCEYSSGPDNNRTWHNFYLAKNFTGSNAPVKANELLLQGWDFADNLMETLNASLDSSSAAASFAPTSPGARADDDAPTSDAVPGEQADTDTDIDTDTDESLAATSAPTPVVLRATSAPSVTAFTVASPTSSPTATRRRTLLAPLSKRELKAAGSETKTARALLQDANDNACTLVPVDLRNQPHDISGDTTFSTEMHEMSCESQTRTHRYQYLLPPRYTLSVRQTFNTYDSVVELRIGGSCPGTDVAYCQDDPDVDEISVTNTFSEAQLVYYLQGGYDGDTGSYEFSWSVTPPSVAIASLWSAAPCAAIELGQSGTTTVILSEGVEEVTLSCTSQASPTSMFAFTVPSGYKLNVSVDLPASGPSSRAHELRKGDSCPGSGGIECAQFGVQLDGTPTSSNNELVWFNFDSVETTVYYHIQDLSDANDYYDSEEPELTLRWSMTEMGGYSCDTAIDLSLYTSPMAMSTVIGSDFLTPTCSQDSLATKDLLLTHSVPPGHTIVLRPTGAAYASAHELRVGEEGSCSASTVVQCFDSAQSSAHVAYANTGNEIVQAYYVQSGNDGSQGEFVMEWMVDRTSLFTGCYANPGDSQSVIGCMCHASCQTCGFADYPNGADQCLACPQGKTLFPLHIDGTGYCGEAGVFEYPEALDDWHCSSLEIYNAPLCDAFFDSNGCQSVAAAGVPELDGATVPPQYTIYWAQANCLCQRNPPFDSEGNRFSLESTLKDVCPTFYCESYKECNSYNTLRLEGGRFPWEGRLALDVSIVDANNEVLKASSTVCGINWMYTNAYVACRQLGYTGVLSPFLGEMQAMTAKQSRITNNYFPRGEDGVTYVSNTQCAGDEKHLSQCPTSYEQYFPNAQDAPKCQEQSVVNLQCWPGADEYSAAACEVGRCCSAGCVPKSTTSGNGVNSWPLERMQTAPFLECTDAEGSCNDVMQVQGDGKCDAQCANAACFMDHWDCCPAGQVLDERSTGSTTECCQPVSVTGANSALGFTLNKFNVPSTVTSTFRGISINRVICGVMMHQKRSPLQTNDNRFNKLYETIASTGTDSTPFGLNPYLYSVSPMYRGHLNTSLYYRPEELVSGLTVNGDNQTQYKAFAPYEVKSFGLGFPVIFSNSLDATHAQELLDYMKYGHYYDKQTDELVVEYILYNGNLDLFCIYRMHFIRSDGGSINWRYSVIPVDVNLYTTTGDFVRLVFELIYVACVLLGTYSELNEIFETKKLTNSFMNYFESAWNYVDAISISMSLVSIALWIVSAWYSSAVFDINLVYDVYTFPPHQWGRLLYNTSELSAMADAFDQLHVLGRLQSTYISLCGANLFLFLLRIFKLLDFQPRMGILTRTISRAMGDLMHFFLLLATVLVLYMLMGHIIFGPTIEVFSTLQYSLQTIFDMLLGEFSDTEKLLLSRYVDYGVLTIPAVMFFYSFMSIVFLVILNFLLAIVVDAFADEKSREGEYHSSMFTEVGSLLKRMTLMTSSEFRAKQSLEAIREAVGQMQSVDLNVVGDDGYSGAADRDAPAAIPVLGRTMSRKMSDRLYMARTRAQVVEMRDQHYKVMLDQKLLYHVLSTALNDSEEAELSSAQIHNLASAAVQAFGESQAGATMADPVQEKDTDPVFVKLLQLQQTMEKNNRAVDALSRDVDLLKAYTLPPGSYKPRAATQWPVVKERGGGLSTDNSSGVNNGSDRKTVVDFALQTPGQELLDIADAPESAIQELATPFMVPMDPEARDD